MNRRIWTFSPVGGRIFLAADGSREQLQSLGYSVNHTEFTNQHICVAHLQAALDVKGRSLTFKSQLRELSIPPKTMSGAGNDFPSCWEERERVLKSMTACKEEVRTVLGHEDA